MGSRPLFSFRTLSFTSSLLAKAGPFCWKLGVYRTPMLGQCCGIMRVQGMWVFCYLPACKIISHKLYVISASCGISDVCAWHPWMIDPFSCLTFLNRSVNNSYELCLQYIFRIWPLLIIPLLLSDLRCYHLSTEWLRLLNGFSAPIPASCAVHLQGSSIETLLKWK